MDRDSSLIADNKTRKMNIMEKVRHPEAVEEKPKGRRPQSHRKRREVKWKVTIRKVLKFCRVGVQSTYSFGLSEFCMGL